MTPVPEQVRPLVLIPGSSPSPTARVNRSTVLYDAQQATVVALQNGNPWTGATARPHYHAPLRSLAIHFAAVQYSFGLPDAGCCLPGYGRHHAHGGHDDDDGRLSRLPDAFPVLSRQALVGDLRWGFAVVAVLRGAPAAVVVAAGDFRGDLAAGDVIADCHDSVGAVRDVHGCPDDASVSVHVPADGEDAGHVPVEQEHGPRA